MAVFTSHIFHGVHLLTVLLLSSSNQPNYQFAPATTILKHCWRECWALFENLIDVSDFDFHFYCRHRAHTQYSEMSYCMLSLTHLTPLLYDITTGQWRSIASSHNLGLTPGTNMYSIHITMVLCPHRVYI